MFKLIREFLVKGIEASETSIRANNKALEVFEQNVRVSLLMEEKIRVENAYTKKLLFEKDLQLLKIEKALVDELTVLKAKKGKKTTEDLNLIASYETRIKELQLE